MHQKRPIKSVNRLEAHCITNANVPTLKVYLQSVYLQKEPSRLKIRDLDKYKATAKTKMLGKIFFR